MLAAGRIALGLYWIAWAYPFAFRAPHRQKRPSITAMGPTFAGLLLEVLAIAIALHSACRPPPARDRSAFWHRWLRARSPRRSPGLR